MVGNLLINQTAEFRLHSFWRQVADTLLFFPAQIDIGNLLEEAAAPSSAAFGAVGGGGYNFQSTGGGGGSGGGAIDRYEHYRRPPSRPASREQSVDRLHAGGDPAAPNRVSRPPSRNRAPMSRPPSSAGAPSADDFAFGLKANGGIANRDPSVGGGLRHRQTSGPRQPPAQYDVGATAASSVAIGAIPKRTESLYMKIPEGAAVAGAKVIW